MCFATVNSEVYYLRICVILTEDLQKMTANSQTLIVIVRCILALEIFSGSIENTKQWGFSKENFIDSSHLFDYLITMSIFSLRTFSKVFISSGLVSEPNSTPKYESKSGKA